MIYAYFILIFLAGILNSKTNNRNEYFYLSRKLTLPSFVATIVTTWYGGILEIGRFTYINGFVTWLIFGFFYYIAALIFAFKIGPKLNQNNIKSIPDFFELKYGAIPKKISAIILILVSSPAPYLMILSILITHIFEINSTLSISFGIFFSIFYIYFGGMKSIIRTDIIQFIFMYLGFFVLLFFLIFKFGGYDFILNNAPPTHLKFTGNLKIGYILSWSLISLITFIDPSIYHRTYSSKDKETVKNGFIISVFLWFVFDFLTISVGLYASAIIPTSLIGDINPYIYLAEEYLPYFLKSLFYIGLLSIVMSTIDSFFFVSSIMLSNDLFNEDSKINRYSLFIIGIVSFIIATNFNHVVDVWYIFGSLAASSLLIPFLLLIFKPNRIIKYPIFSMILPLITGFIWFYFEYPFGIDIMYPGLLISGILCMNSNEE